MPDTDTPGPACETNRFARHPVHRPVGIVFIGGPVPGTLFVSADKP